ncbi:hypothetical protein [Variovorax soli]|jgi:hypothetical protein|uniref:hypothetical protein n=1 Tax=Variovorax soli TaxID=376815 RepID=UPI0008384D0C|nr:hypothetical protein [Variovorax soli]
MTAPNNVESWLGLDALCGTAEAWTWLEENQTDWYDAYQAVSPWAATKAELVDLATTAPNGFARGVIYGWLAARQDIASQTGITF